MRALLCLLFLVSLADAVIIKALFRAVGIDPETGKLCGCCGCPPPPAPPPEPCPCQAAPCACPTPPPPPPPPPCQCPEALPPTAPFSASPTIGYALPPANLPGSYAVPAVPLPAAASGYAVAG